MAIGDVSFNAYQRARKAHWDAVAPSGSAPAVLIIRRPLRQATPEGAENNVSKKITRCREFPGGRGREEKR